MCVFKILFSEQSTRDILNRFKSVLGVYFARTLNDRLAGKPLIINTVDPGFCKSSIGRNRKGVESFIFNLLSKTVGRTSEEGSRQLVWAAVGGEDQKENLRGAFVDMASKNWWVE